MKLLNTGFKDLLFDLLQTSSLVTLDLKHKTENRLITMSGYTIDRAEIPSILYCKWKV